MSKQAENFIALCKGNAVSSVERAISMVKSSVRKELEEKYGCSGNALAVKIALGM